MKQAVEMLEQQKSWRSSNKKRRQAELLSQPAFLVSVI
jgi:hypothetical protein